MQIKKNRIDELSRLMQIAYEDRMKGKMPEELCFSFIQKYSDEQKTLTNDLAELEKKLTETEKEQQSEMHPKVWTKQWRCIFHGKERTNAKKV